MYDRSYSDVELNPDVLMVLMISLMAQYEIDAISDLISTFVIKIDDCIWLIASIHRSPTIHDGEYVQRDRSIEERTIPHYDEGSPDGYANEGCWTWIQEMECTER